MFFEWLVSRSVHAGFRLAHMEPPSLLAGWMQGARPTSRVLFFWLWRLRKSDCGDGGCVEDGGV